MKNKIKCEGNAFTGTESTFGLSGAALKWIAMITMLIDHIGAVVMEYGLYYQGGAEAFHRILENGNGQWLYTLQRLIRMLGRPVFFFAVQFSSGRRIFTYQEQKTLWASNVIVCPDIGDPF